MKIILKSIYIIQNCMIYDRLKFLLLFYIKLLILLIFIIKSKFLELFFNHLHKK